MTFKELLKHYFLILKVRDRFSAQVQIGQRSLYHYYHERARNGDFPSLNDCGFRVFSQFEEDGLLLALFAAIGMGQRRFIEIGSDDGVNSNCANLALNFGWYGLFIDSNKVSIRRGRRFYSKYPHPWSYQPRFVNAHVTPENINNIISQHGLSGEVELLSIDIDGNDYWIWNALEIVEPKVVIIETHVMFGKNNIVVPYNLQEVHTDYHGASPVAMIKLGNKKGYRLIGANQLGFNFIFLKNGIADELFPEVSLDLVLSHPSVHKSFERFESIRSRKYVTPIE